MWANSFASSMLKGALTLAISLAVTFSVQWRFNELLSKSTHHGSHSNQVRMFATDYAFRERPFQYDNTSNYDIAWIGSENGQPALQWRLKTGETAVLKVTRRSAEVVMPGCTGNASDYLHVLLEGPALVAPLEVKQAGQVFIATLTAYDVGAYNVHIEIMFTCSQPQQGKMNYNAMKRIVEHPMHLQVDKGKRAGFPRKRCQDFRWRHGRWMECAHTPLPCVRTGWVWVPSSCHYEIITPYDMVNGDPTWIVFAGSSVERGSFLSLVDYVLDDRARNLTVSDFWKCWGWMNLQIGNLRISYLDFRVMYSGIASNQSHPSYEARYLEHAIIALNTIGNDGRGPDVFHLELPRSSSPTDIPQSTDWADMVRSWLGVRWSGKFLVSAQKPYPTRYHSRDFEKPMVYTWLDEHSSDIEYVDETHMSLAALHDTENSLTSPHWSQHYHRRCDVGAMHVCSVTCDASSQQILNLAYSKRRRRVAASSDKVVNSVQTMPMEFCMFCPPDLVPFTIKPLANKKEFTCSGYLPSSRATA